MKLIIQENFPEMRGLIFQFEKVPHSVSNTMLDDGLTKASPQEM